jgi:predicted Ser/Thr protein kinase/tetratricopeptide (TPR) repeat protein
MGQVYLAEDPQLERRVAIKLLHDDPANRGLREEAKTLAALRHSGIVTIFEIAEHEGRDFIAMEYLPGKPLRELLEAGTTPRTRLIEICAEVANAVAAAHQANILHRDIKPENVVVTDDGEVKVVDFGIARRQLPERSVHASAHDLADMFATTVPVGVDRTTVPTANTRSVFGTPAYMAPELLHGEPASEASDVYSLGIVLHECIAGRRPHAGKTLAELIANIVDGPPATLDDPLGDLIASMLDPDPGQRPALVDVALALEAKPTILAPPVIERRSHTLSLVIAGFAVALVAVGGIVLLARTDDTPSFGPAATPPITSSIQLHVKHVNVQGFANGTLGVEPVTDLLYQRLSNVTGARIIPAKAREQPAIVVEVTLERIPKRRRAKDSEPHELHATVKLAPPGVDAAPIDIDRSDENGKVELAPLIDDIVLTIARRIAPDASLPSPNAADATWYVDRGKQVLADNDRPAARLYLEQAVRLDPGHAEAWSLLTIALTWLEAREDILAAAAEKAIELSQPGPRQQLMRAVVMYIDEDYQQAREQLEPLARTARRDDPDRKLILYYLGEANWHDGRYGAGYAYFKQLLDEDPKFRLATTHAVQYAGTRRLEAQAMLFTGLAGGPVDNVTFALRRHGELADGDGPMAVPSRIVLRRPVPDAALQLAFGDAFGIYRVATAIEARDLARARRELEETWSVLRRRPLDSHLFHVTSLLGEVLLAGELAEESKQLVDFLAEQARGKRKPPRDHDRFAVLAAALLRDPARIPAKLNERNTRLATAIRAELAGDHATAAAVLEQLVGDPSAEWDFPERVALLRNLRKLRRARDAATLCKDLGAPAVFRFAYIVARAACSAP